MNVGTTGFIDFSQKVAGGDVDPSTRTKPETFQDNLSDAPPNALPVQTPENGMGSGVWRSGCQEGGRWRVPLRNRPSWISQISSRKTKALWGLHFARLEGMGRILPVASGDR